MSNVVWFDSWESLVNAANQKAKQILRHNVQGPAKDILRKHITEDVYSVYTPKENGWVAYAGGPRITYQRRHVLEGAIVAEFEDENTMVITSLAQPSPSIGSSKFVSSQHGSFLEMLESGNTGLWRGGFARFPVTRAEMEFRTSSAIQSAIKNGITKEIGRCSVI